MSSTEHRVLVDDTSQDINYVGSSWFADSTGSYDSAGNFGAPYRSTLHGTRANSSLSFEFTGTEVAILGTTSVRNDSGVIDPQLQCFVDNISIGVQQPFAYTENNWCLCKIENLVDGHHTITANVTVMKNQTFWFDRIEYKPSEEHNLAEQAISISNADPALRYGSGWSNLGGFTNITTKKGSSLQYEFYGVSLSWFGPILGELPPGQSMGTYSVDGGAPSTFLLQGRPKGGGTVFNQKFFETPKYQMGRHNLTVIYQGSESTTPLTLDRIIVQNGTLPSQPLQPPPVAASAKSFHVGGIVGSVIGAILAVAIIILVSIYLCRNPRKWRRLKEKHCSRISPPMIEPFRYVPVQPSFPQPIHHAGEVSSWSGSGHGLTLQFNHLPISRVGHPSSPMYRMSGDSTNASPISGPVLHYPISSKAREARLSRQRSSPSVPHPRSSTITSLPSPAGSGRYLMHIDSGYRLPDSPMLETVEEIPPQYTMG
ncbi:hypothetical protein CPB83DRAFT_580455 [Crepidotus variabilis]|uniref:Transmembrane protein n=1 Tax=Crepidotus variabilis TaxID=179855 RepID=A0A9P6EP88_9AGAR|nr:hypothetical protein CPB83DRAFT_580455 [Crepidotus variabilis]